MSFNPFAIGYQAKSGMLIRAKNTVHLSQIMLMSNGMGIEVGQLVPLIATVVQEQAKWTCDSLDTVFPPAHTRIPPTVCYCYNVHEDDPQLPFPFADSIRYLYQYQYQYQYLVLEPLCTVTIEYSGVRDTYTM